MRLIKLLKVDNMAVCPFQYADTLDAKFRRRLQNPSKFLRSFIHKGMHVLDLGCGTGFCTFDIARLLNDEGTVVAADLQPEMLNCVQQRASHCKDKDLIQFHQCQSDSIGWVGDKFDFILLFYMFHEIPNQKKTLEELKSLLQPDGQILIVEPLFHVNKKLFASEKQLVQKSGFTLLIQPNIFFSRAMLLRLSMNS